MAENNMRERTISYLRAAWAYGVTPSGTLEEIVRRSLTALPTRDDVTRPFLAGKATIKDRRTGTQGGVYLHLVAWSDRQGTSAGPHSIEKPLLLVAAGEDWDYLTRNGMVLIRDNHCLLVPGFNIRISSMKNYLIDIVDHARSRSADVQEEDSYFALLPIENPRKVREIYDEGGVRRIDLDVGRYAHSEMPSLERVGTLAKLQDTLAGWIDASLRPSGLADEGDLNLKLLVTPGRRGGNTSLKYEKARLRRSAGKG